MDLSRGRSKPITRGYDTDSAENVRIDSSFDPRDETNAAANVPLGLSGHISWHTHSAGWRIV